MQKIEIPLKIKGVFAVLEENAVDNLWPFKV